MKKILDIVPVSGLGVTVDWVTNNLSMGRPLTAAQKFQFVTEWLDEYEKRGLLYHSGPYWFKVPRFAGIGAINANNGAGLR